VERVRGVTFQPAEEALADAMFRKYDGGGKGRLAPAELQRIMEDLGFEVCDNVLVYALCF
jgi:hypothetical protein